MFVLNNRKCTLSGWRQSRHAASLHRHDYKDILNSPVQQTDSGMDVYISCRAHLILGFYKKAESLVNLLPPDSDLKKFLTAQMQLYADRNVGMLAAFNDLSPHFARDSYLNAECHFVGGYTCLLGQQYKVALRYFQAAADSYAAAGLPGCEASALFNLCVAHDHLDERDAFELCRKRLETLASRTDSLSIRPIRHLVVRTRALSLFDHEQFAEAADAYSEALSMVEKDQRWYDYGALSCMLLFCLSKLNRDQDAISLVDAMLRNSPVITPKHLTMINALRSLIDKPFFQRDELPWLDHLAEQVEGVHLILLYELVLERVAKTEDVSLLIELAQKAQKASLNRQQSLGLVDLKIYEIQGLLKLGQWEQGENQLTAYRNDAWQRGNAKRLYKASQLNAWLRAQKENLNLAASSKLPRLMTLDLTSNQLWIDDRPVDLANKPVFEKFLLLMMTAGEPQSIAEVFSQLYGCQYHPARHERRLHSLMGRLRLVTGETDIIKRRNGQLVLAPSVKYIVRRSVKESPLVNERRRQIFEWIADHGEPVGIADLERVFPCTRRTLQMDLANMVMAGVIRCSGIGRLRRYSLWK